MRWTWQRPGSRFTFLKFYSNPFRQVSLSSSRPLSPTQNETDQLRLTVLLLQAPITLNPSMSDEIRDPSWSFETKILTVQCFMIQFLTFLRRMRMSNYLFLLRVHQLLNRNVISIIN